MREGELLWLDATYIALAAAALIAVLAVAIAAILDIRRRERHGKPQHSKRAAA